LGTDTALLELLESLFELLLIDVTDEVLDSAEAVLELVATEEFPIGPLLETDASELVKLLPKLARVDDALVATTLELLDDNCTTEDDVVVGDFVPEPPPPPQALIAPTTARVIKIFGKFMG
jgi:hypothetical protein